MNKNVKIAKELVKIAKGLVSGGLGSEDERQLKKDIEKFRQKIIMQVKRKGVHENLGQKEVHQLKDKYNCFNYNIGKLIAQFEDWCGTYEG